MELVGVTKDPLILYNELKEMKFKIIINIYCSIIFDVRLRELHVNNDAGRLFVLC